MYVSIDESPAQKWCAENGVEVPQMRSWTEVMQFLDKSKYAVERAFDGLQPKLCDIVQALADIEPTDFEDPISQGNHLRDFSDDSKKALAYAVRACRQISNAFPNNIRVSDFLKIDRSISRGNHAKN